MLSNVIFGVNIKLIIGHGAESSEKILRNETFRENLGGKLSWLFYPYLTDSAVDPCLTDLAGHDFYKIHYYQQIQERPLS